MNKRSASLIAKLIAAIGAAAALSCITAGAEWLPDRQLGDINNDGELTVADLAALSSHVLGSSPLGNDAIAEYPYSIRIKFGANAFPSAPPDPFEPPSTIDTADLNQDGRVDTFDVVSLRKMLVDDTLRAAIMRWEEEPPQPPAPQKFIDPPIYDLYGSTPSQGVAEYAVFYVDFPDCRYSYTPTPDSIRSAMFGEEDPSSPSYPFESLNAFYKRSSKGAVELDGQVYTYTTKQPKSYYEGDVWHVALVEELLAAFDSQVDFSQFDGDGDHTIDTILISVPTAAGDDDWWPAAGEYGGECYNRADGMNIGHVIVGNAELTADSTYDFVSSYAHESGHCMGLPDYYLYHGDDFQGMHGSAGFALMDDANCDFCAASKLMLGWYTEEQIQVYDPTQGPQSFKLTNSQSPGGNCIIIPRADLSDKYRSEFFIIEYTSMEANNSGLTAEWWRATGSGVRILHVEAAVTGDPWYNSWKYASGEDEATNYDQGRRFIRLVGEGDNYTDNLLKTGDVVSSSTAGFQWYDYSGGLTIAPGVTVYIGEKTADGYTIVITN